MLQGAGLSRRTVGLVFAGQTPSCRCRRGSHTKSCIKFSIKGLAGGLPTDSRAGVLAFESGACTTTRWFARIACCNLLQRGQLLGGQLDWCFKANAVLPLPPRLSHHLSKFSIKGLAGAVYRLTAERECSHSEASVHNDLSLVLHSLLCVQLVAGRSTARRTVGLVFAEQTPSFRCRRGSLTKSCNAYALMFLYYQSIPASV